MSPSFLVLAEFEWKQFGIDVLSGLVSNVFWVTAFCLFAYWQMRKILASGRHTYNIWAQSIVFGQDGDNTVLCIRSAGKTTTKSVCADDPERRKLLEKLMLAASASIGSPLLAFSGVQGALIYTELFAHFCALHYNENLTKATEHWLFVVVSERSKFTGQTCVRCFFIKQDDLMKFLNIPFCRSLRVEALHHSHRILTLMQLAIERKKMLESGTSSQCVSGVGVEAKLQTSQGLMWIADVSLRSEAKPTASLTVNWESEIPKKAWDESFPPAPIANV